MNEQGHRHTPAEGRAATPPFRVAVVGSGAIAEHSHVPALRAAGDRVELVAAVDTDAERLDVFQNRNDIPAGGAYASVVFQHRFGSGARHAARLIASGELGRPLVALCNTTWYRNQEYFDVPWRGRWDTEGGGPTMGHGIHQMDLMLALLGDWVEVRAMTGRLDRVMETEDVSMAIVRFADGAMASVVNSVLSPREESYLRFDFTDATIELTHLYGYDNSDWRYTPAPHVADADRIASWSLPPQNVRSSHSAQLSVLLDAMERGERPPLSGRQGRETLELVTALYRSALTGLPVTRDQLGPDDPFYHHLHGDMPERVGSPTGTVVNSGGRS